MRLKIKWKVFLLALAVCLLAACSAGGEKESEVTTLTYANLTKGGVDYSRVLTRATRTCRSRCGIILTTAIPAEEAERNAF